MSILLAGPNPAGPCSLLVFLVIEEAAAAIRAALVAERAACQTAISPCCKVQTAEPEVVEIGSRLGRVPTRPEGDAMVVHCTHGACG